MKRRGQGLWRWGRWGLWLALGLLLALPALLLSCWHGPRPVAAEQAAAAPSPPVAVAPGELPPLAYDRARIAGNLQDERIKESSGMAWGWANDNVLWTHNDSGDSAVLYAIDTKARARGRFVVDGAESRDWEDIASFQAGGQSYLLIGDLGDNAGKRQGCTLYLVAEPRLPAAPEQGQGKLPVLARIDYGYEGGPADCESLAVDAAANRIYLVRKVHDMRIRADQSEVYELNLPALPLSGKLPAALAQQTARIVARLYGPMFTAMDIAADNQHAVVLSYVDLVQYTRQKDETWPQAFAKRGQSISLILAAQREGICYGRDSQTLWVSTEGKGSALLAIPPAAADSD